VVTAPGGHSLTSTPTEDNHTRRAHGATRHHHERDNGRARRPHRARSEDSPHLTGPLSQNRHSLTSAPAGDNHTRRAHGATGHHHERDNSGARRPHRARSENSPHLTGPLSPNSHSPRGGSQPRSGHSLTSTPTEDNHTHQAHGATRHHHERDNSGARRPHRARSEDSPHLTGPLSQNGHSLTSTPAGDNHTRRAHGTTGHHDERDNGGARRPHGARSENSPHLTGPLSQNRHSPETATAPKCSGDPGTESGRMPEWPHAAGGDAGHVRREAPG